MIVEILGLLILSSIIVGGENYIDHYVENHDNKTVLYFGWFGGKVVVLAAVLGIIIR